MVKLFFYYRSNVFKFSGKDDFSISSFCNKMSQRSLLACGISQKRKADSEKTVSSDQPAQKKCKTNSGSGSASNSRVFQPQ